MRQQRLQFIASLGAFLYLPLLIAPVILTRTWREIDRDEGINLVKALLIDRGYRLHSEIWSDQPPFYPHFVSGVAHFFPGSLDAVRIVSLALVSLLFWALYEFVKLHRGVGAGLLSILFLGSFAYAFRYSGAVMIGLPCLSLGMLSLLATNLALRKKRPALGFVAGAFGVLSVMTKFYGGIFAFPVIVALALEQDRKVAVRFLLWGLVGVGTALVYILSLAPGLLGPGFWELFESHLGAQDSRVPAGFRRLRTLLARDRFSLLLALLGILGAWRRRSVYLLQVLSLAILGATFLYFHRPVWNHHYPLLALPLSVLAMEGSLSFLELANQVRRKFLGAIFLVLLGLSLLKDTTEARRRIQKVGYRLSAELIPQIQSNLSGGGELFTDRPIYLFISGAKTSPEHAVITTKRLRSGELPQGEVIEDLQQTMPKLILLNRFPKFRGNVLRALGDKYREVWRREDALLLRRLD